MRRAISRARRLHAWVLVGVALLGFVSCELQSPTETEGSGGETGGGTGRGSGSGPGGGPSGSTSATVSTRGGPVQLSLQGGVFAQNPDTVNVAPPPRYQLPYGAIGFVARLPQAGGTLTVTLTFPNALPNGARIYKRVGTDWQDVTAQVTISGSTVTLSVADGSPWDADGQRNAEVRDPVAVALSAPVQVTVNPLFTVFVVDTTAARGVYAALTPNRLVAGGGIYAVDAAQGTARLLGFAPSTVPSPGNEWDAFVAPNGRYVAFVGSNDVNITYLPDQASAVSVPVPTDFRSACRPSPGVVGWSEPSAAGDTILFQCLDAALQLTPSGATPSSPFMTRLSDGAFDRDFPRPVFTAVTYTCGDPPTTCVDTVTTYLVRRVDHRGNPAVPDRFVVRLNDNHLSAGGTSSSQYLVMYYPGTWRESGGCFAIRLNDNAIQQGSAYCDQLLLRRYQYHRLNRHGAAVDIQGKEWWLVGAQWQQSPNFAPLVLQFANPWNPTERVQLPVEDARGSATIPSFALDIPTAETMRGGVLFLSPDGAYVGQAAGDRLVVRFGVPHVRVRYSVTSGLDRFGQARPVGSQAVVLVDQPFLLAPEGGTTQVRFLGWGQGRTVDDADRVWFGSGGVGIRYRLHVFDPRTATFRSSTESGSFDVVDRMAVSSRARRAVVVGSTYTRVAGLGISRQSQADIWDTETMSRVGQLTLPTFRTGGGGPEYLALKFSGDGTRLLGLETCVAGSFEPAYCAGRTRYDAVHVFDLSGQVLAWVRYDFGNVALWGADISEDGQRFVLAMYAGGISGNVDDAAYLLVFRIDGSGERTLVNVGNRYNLTVRGVQLEKTIRLRGTSSWGPRPVGDVALLGNGEFALVGGDGLGLGWAPQLVDLVEGAVIWQGPALNRQPYLGGWPTRRGAIAYTAYRSTRVEVELHQVTIR